MPADKLFNTLQSKYPSAVVTSTKVETFSKSGKQIGSINKIEVKPAWSKTATHCYYAA